MGVSSATSCSNLSFDTTIKVSTRSRNNSIASSACFILRRPSKAKGLVTIPTVKHPHSFFAISATTGAAPDPVPPPIPAVIKTRSEPCIIFFNSNVFSNAASFPIDGFPPAPNPRVSDLPILITLGTLDFDKACASVLMA